MEQTLFLRQLMQQRVMVNIYLRNGIKLQGYVVKITAYTLWLKATLEDDSPIQTVYKHAISTVSCCVT